MRNVRSKRYVYAVCRSVGIFRVNMTRSWVSEYSGKYGTIDIRIPLSLTVCALFRFDNMHLVMAEWKIVQILVKLPI